MTGETTTVTPVPLGQNRDFRLLWLSAVFSILATKVSAFIWPLLVLWQGGSPAQAGLVGFAALLPQFVVQLPAGVLIDRLDRRRVMIACDLIGCAVLTSVVVALLTGGITMGHLMAAAFVESTAGIGYQLCERAAVRNLVHPTQLPSALSRNEARGRATSLLGQPASTALLGLARFAPLVLGLVSHLVSLCTLLSIKGKFQSDDGAPRGKLRTDLAEGLTWVWRQRLLRVAIPVIGGTNILFQVLGLALVVAIRDSGQPPIAVGLLGVGAGLGGVFGALSSSWWMHRLSFPMIFVGTMVVWTVLMPAMSFTTNWLVLAGLYAVICTAAGVSNVMGGVYQVRITPERMQGRASSVSGLISSGCNSLGPPLGGVLLSAYGPANTILGVGAAMAVFTALALASSAVRHAEHG